VDSLRPRYSRHQLCRGYLLEVPRKVTVPRQKKALGHELRRMAAGEPPPVGVAVLSSVSRSDRFLYPLWCHCCLPYNGRVGYSADNGAFNGSAGFARPCFPTDLPALGSCQIVPGGFWSIKVEDVAAGYRGKSRS
jgi:hypothetical protein